MLFLMNYLVNYIELDWWLIYGIIFGPAILDWLIADIKKNNKTESS